MICNLPRCFACNLYADDTLLNYLVKKSYSAAYGARNLRRLIQKAQEIVERLEGTVLALLVGGAAKAHRSHLAAASGVEEAKWSQKGF